MKFYKKDYQVVSAIKSCRDHAAWENETEIKRGRKDSADWGNAKGYTGCEIGYLEGHMPACRKCIKKLYDNGILKSIQFNKKDFPTFHSLEVEVNSRDKEIEKVSMCNAGISWYYIDQYERFDRKKWAVIVVIVAAFVTTFVSVALNSVIVKYKKEFSSISSNNSIGSTSYTIKGDTNEKESLEQNRSQPRNDNPNKTDVRSSGRDERNVKHSKPNGKSNQKSNTGKPPSRTQGTLLETSSNRSPSSKDTVSQNGGASRS